MMRMTMLNDNMMMSTDFADGVVDENCDEYCNVGNADADDVDADKCYDYCNVAAVDDKSWCEC